MDLFRFGSWTLFQIMGVIWMGTFLLFPPYTPNALFSARIIRSQHSFIACCRLRILHIRFCVYLLTISTALMTPIAKFTTLILYTNNNPFLPTRPWECECFLY